MSMGDCLSPLSATGYHLDQMEGPLSFLYPQVDMMMISSATGTLLPLSSVTVGLEGSVIARKEKVGLQGGQGGLGLGTVFSSEDIQQVESLCVETVVSSVLTASCDLSGEICPEASESLMAGHNTKLFLH